MHEKTSIIVTTFGSDSYYTQACLESIRAWKGEHHELIVVTHDETPLLRAYLESARAEGLIDMLVFTVSGHGHTRGYNLGVQHSTGDVLFNICNDILIGPEIVDHCARQLREDPQIGIVGWHWYSEGTRWVDERIPNATIRDSENPYLSPDHVENIESAPWFTGRYFRGIGGKKWIQLCNTSFFGIRRETLDKVGGGFGWQYEHYWADDFLNYAVLDQGLDIRHFDQRFRRREHFHEFQYENMHAADRERHADRVLNNRAFLEAIRPLNGGMTEGESAFLHLLASSVPDGSTVTNLGVWLGSSAIVLLEALREKNIRFHFIDCFDLPGISAMSAQPPVTQEQFMANIGPYVRNGHEVVVNRANSLELEEIPRSDFVFVDAGHTAECVTHDAALVKACLKARGVAAFHDYGQSSWPAVKPTLDEAFGSIGAHETVGVYRDSDEDRLEYRWKDKPEPLERAVDDNEGSNPLRVYFDTNQKRSIIHKWLHYFDVYQCYFERFRGRECVFLEIGVEHGGSLEMWREYLGSSARVVGIDIDPRCSKLAPSDVEVFIGDQSDPGFLSGVLEVLGGIDVVVDDGGHSMEQQLRAFEHLYPAVRPGGVYVVEDAHTSYFPEYGGGLRRPGTFMEFAKGQIDQLNAWHSRDCESLLVDEFTRTTLAMHFYDSMVVFEKAKRSKPSAAVVGVPNPALT